MVFDVGTHALVSRRRRTPGDSAWVEVWGSAEEHISASRPRSSCDEVKEIWVWIWVAEESLFEGDLWEWSIDESQKQVCRMQDRIEPTW